MATTKPRTNVKRKTASRSVSVAKTKRGVTKKQIIPFLALLAIVGGFFAYKTFASSWREVAHSGTYMTYDKVYISKGTRVRFCGRVTPYVKNNSSVIVYLNYGYTTSNWPYNAAKAGRRVSSSTTLACGEATAPSSAYYSASIGAPGQSNKIVGTSLSVFK